MITCVRVCVSDGRPLPVPVVRAGLRQLEAPLAVVLVEPGATALAA